jgi:hypothetical protein
LTEPSSDNEFQTAAKRFRTRMLTKKGHEYPYFFAASRQKGQNVLKPYTMYNTLTCYTIYYILHFANVLALYVLHGTALLLFCVLGSARCSSNSGDPSLQILLMLLRLLRLLLLRLTGVTLRLFALLLLLLLLGVCLTPSCAGRSSVSSTAALNRGF